MILSDELGSGYLNSPFDSHYFDKRLIRVKDIISVHGSEEHFVLLVSPIKSWAKEAEFIHALKLFSEEDEDSDYYGKAEDHFSFLLKFFNSFMPNQITLNPSSESPKKVLIDIWCCKAIIWQENECYFAYSWSTTA